MEQKEYLIHEVWGEENIPGRRGHYDWWLERGSLTEKQLGVGSVDPHAEPEGHQDGVNLFKQSLPWVWG